MEERRLSRADLERVIGRAAELESGTGSDARDIGEADVLRIAGEVGLSEGAVRRALAEHFASVPAGRLLSERGLVSRVCGPGLIVVSRTVPLAAGEALEALESHFRTSEILRLVRRVDSGSMWEPDPGFVASLLRTVNLSGRGYKLGKARAIELRVIPLADESSHVTLIADMTKQRAEWFWGVGIAMGGPLSGVTGLLAALATGAPVVAVGALPVLAGSIWGARAGYRKNLDSMQMTLEGLLDRLQHGEPLEFQRPSWRELLS